MIIKKLGVELVDKSQNNCLVTAVKVHIDEALSANYLVHENDVIDDETGHPATRRWVHHKQLVGPEVEVVIPEGLLGSFVTCSYNGKVYGVVSVLEYHMGKCVHCLFTPQGKTSKGTAKMMYNEDILLLKGDKVPPVTDERRSPAGDEVVSHLPQ